MSADGPWDGMDRGQIWISDEYWPGTQVDDGPGAVDLQNIAELYCCVPHPIRARY